MIEPTWLLEEVKTLLEGRRTSLTDEALAWIHKLQRDNDAFSVKNVELEVELLRAKKQRERSHSVVVAAARFVSARALPKHVDPDAERELIAEVRTYMQREN